MIETRTSRSATDEPFDEFAGSAFHTPIGVSHPHDAASSFANASWNSVPNELSRNLGPDYTAASFSQFVHRAVHQRQRPDPRLPNWVFRETRSMMEPAAALEALSRAAEFTDLFESNRDLVLFVYIVQHYPDVLDRSMRLVAMAESSENVESVSIEVDDEDSCVLVWVNLDVEDNERLQVKMELFEEGERILGEMSGSIRLAMI